MKNFSEVKSKFLEEFEKETADLGEKWREVQILTLKTLF
jgi:hypothetical protein